MSLVIIDPKNVRTNHLPMTSDRLIIKSNKKNQPLNRISDSSLSQVITQDFSQSFSQNTSQVLNKFVILICYSLNKLICIF